MGQIIQLRECIDSLETLTEIVDGVKDYFLHGPVIKMNFKNKNEREYEDSIVVPQVEKYNKDKVAINDAWGELDHPETSSMNLSKMVCAFKQPLIIEGNDVIGKAKILKNIWGTIVTVAIDENIRLGFSSRGTGEVVNVKGRNYVRNWTLITPADIVSNPSIGEYPNTVQESKLAKTIVEMVVEGEKRMTAILECEVVQSVVQAVNASPSHERMKVIHEQFENILKSV